MTEPSSLDQIRRDFLEELGQASGTSGLDALKVRYLGKKGLVTAELKKLSAMGPDERREFGQKVNDLKNLISDQLTASTAAIKDKELQDALLAHSIDITMPGAGAEIGSEHPVHQIIRRIEGIFTEMGFSVEQGPEVESDYYNFEALNFPKEHPARDMQDTFFVSDDVVLRTHTSPVQIRAMERLTPPLRVIAPGKVYRCDADISHTPVFHQVEGLMVGEDITFSHLKGILETFIHKYFGPNIPVRFRPSFFPFTEPSAEVDMGCIFCGGKGCRICKTTGWIEILGSGMVHPNVLRMGGVDPEKYTGFAFGMGIERIAMLTWGIDDIRMLFENDIRFLKQF